MIKTIKKYLPDILIVLAIWMIASSLLTPARNIFNPSKTPIGAIFGIVLFAIGIDIVVRRYLKSKKSKE